MRIFLTLAASFLIVFAVTPSYIAIAKKKKLFDSPDEKRKIHKMAVPSMGGIVIFAGIMISFLLSLPFKESNTVYYLIPAMLILFFVGLKDDIDGVSALKKLAANIVAALIIVIPGGVRVSGFHGLFGLNVIPEWAAVLLSIFIIVAIINAYNLIDGVDGLAAGVGVIASVCFGLWFYFSGDQTLAVLSFAVTGSLAGFLVYNFNPAKVFMGDTGAIVVGFLLSVMAIRMIECDSAGVPAILENVSKPVFAMSVLAYPIIDTLRVFTRRILKGRSPFSADRNHLHHRLMDIGLSQKQSVFVIYVFTLLIIAATVLMQSLRASVAFFMLILIVIVLIQIPFFIRPKSVHR